jgi:hypothetical protein
MTKNRVPYGLLTDEDLLRELIRRNGIVEAPTSRTMHEYEVLLGIGKDHHYYITFHKEDVEALVGHNKDARQCRHHFAFLTTATLVDYRFLFDLDPPFYLILV